MLDCALRFSKERRNTGDAVVVVREIVPMPSLVKGAKKPRQATKDLQICNLNQPQIIISKDQYQRQPRTCDFTISSFASHLVSRANTSIDHTSNPSKTQAFPLTPISLELESPKTRHFHTFSQPYRLTIEIHHRLACFLINISIQVKDPDPVVAAVTIPQSALLILDYLSPHSSHNERLTGKCQ